MLLKFTNQITPTGIIKLLEQQPENIFVGNNWAGTNYNMSDVDFRRRQRLINKLQNPENIEYGKRKFKFVSLSRAEADYIYAVAANQFSKVHPYQINPYYGTPDETDYRWKAYKSTFKKLHINNYNYRKAWSQ